jgi:hypothetical protein
MYNFRNNSYVTEMTTRSHEEVDMSKSDQTAGSTPYFGRHTGAFSIAGVSHTAPLMERVVHVVRSLFVSNHPATLSELIVSLEEAETPAQLSRTLNNLQEALWNLSSEEQARFRGIAINTLKRLVLQPDAAPLQREAAGWLRAFVQSGQVINPTDIFVTLVTAAKQEAARTQSTSDDAHNPYLKMIFDCFWPYRHPYQAYTWEAFPPNAVFYPLAALFTQANEATEDILLSIFAELPSLDDQLILEHLLPVALRWAQSQDAEQRRRAASLLSRIHHAPAQESSTGPSPI